MTGPLRCGTIGRVDTNPPRPPRPVCPACGGPRQFVDCVAIRVPHPDLMALADSGDGVWQVAPCGCQVTAAQLAAVGVRVALAATHRPVAEA